MYCGKEALARLYRESKSVYPVDNLINSREMEIIDGTNWSFDPSALTIWNNRYWKGFYPIDYGFTNLVLMYGFGFYKRFQADRDQSKGQKVNGETHPFRSDIHAANQAINIDIPEIGKEVYIKYRDFPYNSFDDVIKIIDKDTVIGEAFVSLRKPGHGLPIFHFVLSRKYSLDFMTQADCSFIFDHKARQANADEILGIWDMLLVSDAALSPPLLRLKFSKDNQKSSTDAGHSSSRLRSDLIFDGKISHAGHTASFGEDALISLNLPGEAAKDAIRMVNRDLLVGKLDCASHPILKALENFKEFFMTDPMEKGKKNSSSFILPYVLKRASPL